MRSMSAFARPLATKMDACCILALASEVMTAWNTYHSPSCRTAATSVPQMLASKAHCKNPMEVMEVQEEIVQSEDL